MPFPWGLPHPRAMLRNCAGPVTWGRQKRTLVWFLPGPVKLLVVEGGRGLIVTKMVPEPATQEAISAVAL